MSGLHSRSELAAHGGMYSGHGGLQDLRCLGLGLWHCRDGRLHFNQSVAVVCASVCLEAPLATGSAGHGAHVAGGSTFLVPRLRNQKLFREIFNRMVGTVLRTANLLKIFESGWAHCPATFFSFRCVGYPARGHRLPWVPDTCCRFLWFFRAASSL